jgi:hypothetical protein
MTIGKAGQISSISRTGLLSVQRSFKFNRHGDAMQTQSFSIFDTRGPACAIFLFACLALIMGRLIEIEYF